MRPVTISKLASSTGATAWVPVDTQKVPFSVGLAAVISATATFGVEVTYDDVFDATVTPTAFATTDIPTGTATNKNGALSSPVRAVRLNVAANTGGVVLTILQGGGS